MTEQEVTILDKLGVDVGFKATFSKTITESDISLLAAVSGDYNPVHVNEEYAKRTFFKGRISHGLMPLCITSAAMSACLPGIIVWLSESTRFLAPVRIGDTLTGGGEVTAARKDKGIITMKIACANQRGENVIEGEWVIRLYEPPSY